MIGNIENILDEIELIKNWHSCGLVNVDDFVFSMGELWVKLRDLINERMY